MDYLSDSNLRAVLIVLLGRIGGTVEVTNGELYDAMLPESGGDSLTSRRQRYWPSAGMRGLINR